MDFEDKAFKDHSTEDKNSHLDLSSIGDAETDISVISDPFSDKLLPVSDSVKSDSFSHALES